MATPIRWDNINRRPSTESGQALNSAAGLFNGAFGQIQDALKQHDTIDAANWQNTKANNTNTYLDAVAKLRSPEDIAEAQKSGALDQLRSQFGNQIDANAVRGAADARLLASMQQRQQQIAYNHAMTDERVAPLMDQFKAAFVAGDKVKAAEAQAKYAELGGRDLAGLVSFADTRDRTVTVRGQEDKTFDLNQDRGRQEISASKAHVINEQGMLGVARTNAQTNKDQVNVQREQMQFTAEDRLQQRLQQQLESMGKFANLSPGSPEGQAKIADYIDKIKDPDIQSNARKAAATLSGVKDMTVAGVLSGIGSIDKRDWFTNGDMLYSNSNNVDDAVERGKKFVQSPDAINFQRRQELGYAAAQKGFTDVNERLQTLRSQLYSGGGNSSPTALSGSAPVGTERSLPDKSTYRMTPSGWVRIYTGPNNSPDR